MNKLYRDTVTLYHADAAAQTVVRTVLRGVCWQQGRRELPDAGGTRRGTALLVVIPETTVTINGYQKQGEVSQIGRAACRERV